MIPFGGLKLKYIRSTNSPFRSANIPSLEDVGHDQRGSEEPGSEAVSKLWAFPACVSCSFRSFHFFLSRTLVSVCFLSIWFSSGSHFFSSARVVKPWVLLFFFFFNFPDTDKRSNTSSAKRFPWTELASFIGNKLNTADDWTWWLHAVKWWKHTERFKNVTVWATVRHRRTEQKERSMAVTAFVPYAAFNQDYLHLLCLNSKNTFSCNQASLKQTLVFQIAFPSRTPTQLVHAILTDKWAVRGDH